MNSQYLIISFNGFYAPSLNWTKRAKKTLYCPVVRAAAQIMNVGCLRARGLGDKIFPQNGKHDPCKEAKIGDGGSIIVDCAKPQKPQNIP